jgi:cytosine/adenosine deaminase-related metal-dependent hydrolase
MFNFVRKVTLFQLMNLRKFKADRIFTGKEFLSGSWVLTCTPEGEIVELTEEGFDTENIERLKGTLCPGFINAHCHLELSHMKGVIPKHTGLIPFLMDVVDKRDFPAEHIQEKMNEAVDEMYRDGIVAVGDIGNTANSIATKANGQLVWNNFVEILGFKEDQFDRIRQEYGHVLAQFRETENNLPEGKFKSSLVPHAPYTVGTKIFEWINRETRNLTISCHNQETPAEDELYGTGKGEFLKLLQKFGSKESPFPITGKSSLQSWLPHFNEQQKIILVHNTFTSAEDVDFAIDHAAQSLSGIYFCLCVNANLYIEDQMPPIEMLIDKKAELVLGTDSYSSNDQLSIAAEIRSIRKRLPNVPLEMILRWATYNGAKALDRLDSLGSFEKGKKPGVLLLDENLTARRII